jgi:site-specific recombinase XerD
MTRDEDIANFERYLRRRFPQRRTPVDYVSDVRLFAQACDTPWREIGLHEIDAFVDHPRAEPGAGQRQAGRSPATVQRRVAALKTFFDFLAEERNELDWPNPVRFKRHAGQQPRRLPRDLSNAELERLWAVVDGARDRAWFVLLWRAGLRVGEVVSLTMADVLSPPDATHPARVRVCGKGRKERVVLLSADAYAVLAVWLAQRPLEARAAVFVNARGQPLSVSGIEWRLHQYGQQAGVAVSPHRLRHSFARQVTEAGMPLASVGKLLGHADLSTTQRYTAGADLELSQAYQRAMQHLSASGLPQPPPAPPSADTAPVVAPAAPPPAPAFDPTQWRDWGRDFPAELRQACLAFVQRRWPTWKGGRRVTNAHKILGEFRRFWTWQITHREVSTLTGLGRADLQAYQAERQAGGTAPTTINRTLDYILTLLKEQLDHGQPVAASLFRLEALPHPDRLPRHLSPADSQHLETILRARLEDPQPGVRLELACWFVLAHTGLRASECLDLLGGDLDLAAGRLWVRQGKGQKDRVVYLSATACQALQRYLDDRPLAPGAPLLHQPDGRRVTYAWLYAHIRQLGTAAGVAHVTPHRLRHTLATQLLNAGMDITRIQKLLGHEHLNTTLIYARVHDATVEADYRQAMRAVECLQQPLSSTPEPVANWPAKQKVPIDNSV